MKQRTTSVTNLLAIKIDGPQLAAHTELQPAEKCPCKQDG